MPVRRRPGADGRQMDAETVAGLQATVGNTAVRRVLDEKSSGSPVPSECGCATARCDCHDEPDTSPSPSLVHPEPGPILDGEVGAAIDGATRQSMEQTVGLAIADTPLLRATAPSAAGWSVTASDHPVERQADDVARRATVLRSSPARCRTSRTSTSTRRPRRRRSQSPRGTARSPSATTSCSPAAGTRRGHHGGGPCSRTS